MVIDLYFRFLLLLRAACLLLAIDSIYIFPWRPAFGKNKKKRTFSVSCVRDQGRHTEPDEKGDEKRLKLTIRMMLGVRVAVGRQSNPLDQPGAEISEEEFSQAGGWLPAMVVGVVVVAMAVAW